MNLSQGLKLGLLPVNRIMQRVWNKTTGRAHLPSKPYYASINPTYRCNLKCVHCSLWDRPEGEEEMTLDEMKKVVLDVKNWLSLPALDILGGEAFLRPETMEIIRFATANGVFIKIVTNGTMLTDKVSRELIELGVHKVCISIDGINADTHDKTRGVDGAFERTLRGVERFKSWKDKLGGSTRINISTIVDAATLREIPAVLDWVIEMGLDELHLVPLDQNVGGVEYGADGFNFEDSWFERNPLWVRDIPLLEKVVAYVIEKKRAGYPVADPITYLEHMIPYFRDAGGIQHKRPCRAGSELVRITPQGGMSFCPFEPALGDLRTSTPAEIWTSPEAAAAREKINGCTKKCFIPFCAWDEKERRGRFWQMFVRKPHAAQPRFGAQSGAVAKAKAVATTMALREPLRP